MRCASFSGSPRHQRGVAGLRERVAHEAEHPRVVVDHQDAGELVRLRVRRRGGRLVPRSARLRGAPGCRIRGAFSGRSGHFGGSYSPNLMKTTPNNDIRIHSSYGSYGMLPTIFNLCFSVPVCVCISTTRESTLGSSCTPAARSASEVCSAWRPLDASPALPAVADLDVGAPYNRPHHWEVFLVLRRDALYCDRAAAIRTLGRQRCFMDLVDLRRPPAVCRPPVPGTGSPSRTLATALPPLLGEGRHLAETRASPRVKLLLEPARTAPPAIPVALGARQIPAQTACSHAPVVDAAVPRTPLPPRCIPSHWTACVRKARPSPDGGSGVAQRPLRNSARGVGCFRATRETGRMILILGTAESTTLAFRDSATGSARRRDRVRCRRRKDEHA